MAKYTQEQIEEKFQKMPQALKDVMFNPATTDKILEITDKNNFTIEQSGILGEEIGYIMLGLTKSEDFIKSLKDSLKIDDAVAGSVAKDINQDILFPARDLLKSSTQQTETVAPPIPPKQKTPLFMKKPSLDTSKPAPELIIRPDLKANSPTTTNISRVVLPEKEVQVPSPVDTTIKPPQKLNIPNTQPEIKSSAISEPKTTVSLNTAKASPPPNLPTKPVVESREPEPIKPLTTPIPIKILPIDLRSQIKSLPTNKSASQELPTPLKQITPVRPSISAQPAASTAPTPSTTQASEQISANSMTNKSVTPEPTQTNTSLEKKMPDKGIDVYREPIE